VDQELIDRVVQELERLGGVIAEGGEALIEVTARRIVVENAVLVGLGLILWIAMYAVGRFSWKFVQSYEQKDSYDDTRSIVSATAVVVVLGLGITGLAILAQALPRLLAADAFAIQELIRNLGF